MYKKFAMVLICLSFLSALQAEEESYVFEAKGEFAKELKALVEKYSKEGKIEAKVYEKGYEPQSESKTVTQSILSALSPSDAEDLKYADIAQGEKIYQNQCVSCHGNKADENTYAVPHKLIDLPPVEIVELLEGYKMNYSGDFGGSLRNIMKPHADSLTTTEMQSIAAYIYSLKNGTDLSNIETKTDKEESSNEAPSTYLQ